MKAFRGSSRWLLPILLAVAAACSSKSPTEPSQPPANPKPPVGTPTYNVTVTAKPGTLTIGTNNGSTITVQAASAQDGSAPPNLTPITLTTSLGEFNAIGSGSQSISLQLVNGKASAILYPGTSAGTASVAAVLAPTASSPCGGSTGSPACAGSGATNVTILTAGTFFLNAVSPNTGDPSGGYPVTISGGGFVAPVSVSFNGASAAVTKVGPGSIQVIAPASPTAVPAGSTLPVNITVNNNIGGTVQGTATLTDAFTYVPGGGSVTQPVIFSVTPTSGSNQGNTQVTILGQGFTSPVQVSFGIGATASSFNGVEATVQSVTANKIVVLTPPAQGFGQNNTNQVVNILVKNVNSGFSVIDPGAYKYGSKVIITAVSPTQTVWDQPVTVTIFGQGFEDPVAVTLDNVGAQVLSVSGTEIQVLSPIPTVNTCSSPSGPVGVTNINTGDSATFNSFTFLVQAPIVSSLNPNQGAGNAQTPVTISGGQFDPPLSVTFGGSPGSITKSSTNSISVNAPVFTGTYQTQSCTVGGATGTQEVPTAVTVVVTNLTTGCTTTVSNGFVYTPPASGSACNATGTPPVASFTFTAEHGENTVIFQDTSTGKPTQWSWSFGDTTTSSAENPVHMYTTAGTYTVTLMVTNTFGTSSTSQFVTVPGP
jgi:PKD repeat protein